MKSTTACDDQFAAEPEQPVQMRFEVTLAKSVTTISERTVVLTASSAAEAMRVARSWDGGTWTELRTSISVFTVGLRDLPDLDKIAAHLQALAAESAAAKVVA